MNKQEIANGLKIYERSYFVCAPSYFLLRTGTFASMLSYSKINYNTLYPELMNEYQIDPSKTLTDKRYNSVKNNHSLTSMFIEISDDLMVNISGGKMIVEVLYNSKVTDSELLHLESIIVKHRKPDLHQQMVGIITDDTHGEMEIKYFPVSDAVDDITKYYNDDFLEFDELIKARIKVKNSKGLILLHGDIGSGKTSYIRHLISASKTLKNFIYLPIELSHRISMPSFLTFLIKHATNSVLIIEDSEQLLISRKINSSNAVPALLNFTDGILADVLNIQLICTFNAELPSIDPALLRRGRLITKYNFRPLTIDKANALMAEKGIEYVTDKPLTLAEIFNHDETDFTAKKTASDIGYLKNETINNIK